MSSKKFDYDNKNLGLRFQFGLAYEGIMMNNKDLYRWKDVKNYFSSIIKDNLNIRTSEINNLLNKIK